MIETPNRSRGSHKRRQPGGWPSSADAGQGRPEQHYRAMTVAGDDTHTISSAGNVSINTLAAFLVESTSQTNSNNEGSWHRQRTTASMDGRRQQQMEHQAVINALNQFLLQAGNIYKGKGLSNVEATRLREAADHVGLSMEVVDALLEQTANPNAVVEYCMRSDDAFARKIKEDPNMSRILRRESGYMGGDGLNLSSSIWRVFMHRIIQKFLKKQNLRLDDVMDKSSLTSRLYEEAFREGAKTAESNENELGRSNLHRNFTEERKHVFISEEEARLARMQAEANLNFHSRVPFEDLIHRNSMLMLPPVDLPPGLRDDDLSLIPCAQERHRDGPPNSRHSLPQKADARRQSMPAAANRTARQATTTGKHSVVQRGLAIFEKSSDSEPNPLNKDPRRRKSEGHALSSTVLQRRALFEKGSVSSQPQSRDLSGWQTESELQNSSDLSDPPRNRRLSSSRLALFSNAPTSDSSNETRKGNSFVPSKSPAKSQVSIKSPTHLHTFSHPKNPGGWSDSTMTSFSKQRKSHRKDPGNPEARPLELSNWEYTSNSLDEGRRTSLPGHDHDAHSWSIDQGGNNGQVAKYPSERAFSKPDVICINGRNDDCVKEVYSGLTQTSSHSDAFVEQQSIPSLRERKKHCSKSTNSMSMNQSKLVKRSHKKNPREWIGFNNTETSNTNLTPNGTLPTQSKQQAWQQAFGNRKKPGPIPSNTPRPEQVDSHKTPTVSENYIHSFPTSPTLATNATSSLTLNTTGRFLNANKTNSTVKSNATRLSENPENEWTDFGGNSFVEKRLEGSLSEDEDKFSETDRYMSAYSSSDGNKSSASKPRKYFQKLLKNQIRPPLPAQNTLSTSGSSLTSTVDYHQENNGHYEGVISENNASRNDRLEAQDFTPKWGNDQETRNAWEAFGANHYAESKGKNDGIKTNLVPSKVDTTNKRSSKKRFEKEQETPMAQLSSNGEAVFLSPNRNKVLDLVQQHESKRSKESRKSSTSAPFQSENRRYNQTYQSNNSASQEELLKDSRKTRTHKKEAPIAAWKSKPRYSSPGVESINYQTKKDHIPIERHSNIGGGVLQPDTRQWSIEEDELSETKADAFALRAFRKRRDSLEPSLPIQKGNVEQKKRILEQGRGRNIDMEEDEIDSLKDFLHDYELSNGANARFSLAPPTPLGKHRFSRTETQSQEQRRIYASDLEIKESSSNLSNLLQIETATTDEDDDIGLNSPNEIDWPSEHRIDVQRRSLGPSSPTACRSSDSGEDEFDEAEIRAAAKQNGIPSPIINILIKQSQEAQRRDPQVGRTLTGITKYDSDTGLPASTRHLYNSSHQTLGFNTGRTWDTVEDEKCEWSVSGPNEVMRTSPCANLEDQVQDGWGMRPDPSPVAGLSNPRPSSALPSGMDPSYQSSRPALDVPEGTTSEDLKLLNSFIEVASGNFGGNKLSVESESRVRAAAFKIGLTPKFIDQILKQQHEQNDRNDPFTYEKPQENPPLPAPAYHNYYGQPQQHPTHFHNDPNLAPPYGLGGETYVGETSTYYSADNTRTTKRTKKTQEAEGCNAWETWDTIRSNIGLALAKACGPTTKDNRDDGSSISSSGSWDENTRGPKRNRRRRRSERGTRRDSHYQHQHPPQHQMAHDPNVRVSTTATPTANIAISGTPSNQSVRGYV